MEFDELAGRLGSIENKLSEIVENQRHLRANQYAAFDLEQMTADRDQQMRRAIRAEDRAIAAESRIRELIAVLEGNSDG